MCVCTAYVCIITLGVHDRWHWLSLQDVVFFPDICGSPSFFLWWAFQHMQQWRTLSTCPPIAALLNYCICSFFFPRSFVCLFGILSSVLHWTNRPIVLWNVVFCLWIVEPFFDADNIWPLERKTGKFVVHATACHTHWVQQDPPDCLSLWLTYTLFYFSVPVWHFQTLVWHRKYRPTPKSRHHVSVCLYLCASCLLFARQPH